STLFLVLILLPVPLWLSKNNCRRPIGQSSLKNDVAPIIDVNRDRLDDQALAADDVAVLGHEAGLSEDASRATTSLGREIADECHSPFVVDRVTLGSEEQFLAGDSVAGLDQKPGLEAGIIRLANGKDACRSVAGRIRKRACEEH